MSMVIPSDDSRARITLALVSHTNIGKTALARTLLRRDVGQVLDREHVTEHSEAFSLVRTDDAELWLWDTPGFGDSVRLLRRLKTAQRPLWWLLQQSWDRITDRPLWSSQQAMRTVRDDTDLVLYLVSAAEPPDEAGYVASELDLLAWTERPVLLVINQAGDASPAEAAKRRAAWVAATVAWPRVQGVLDLDAFNRCWVQEGVLFSHLEAALGPQRRPLIEGLHSAWDRRNLEAFARAQEALADYLAATAQDRESLLVAKPGKTEKRKGMEALGARLAARTEGLMSTLLACHGLEGTPPSAVEKAAESFVVEGQAKLDPERSALWGGLLSGALSGLTADALTGGLSFGGGLVAGAILGALGGAGLARGYQLVRGDRLPVLRWSASALDRVAEQAVLRYLAVAHFGRARGAYREAVGAEHWQLAVRRARAAQAASWSRAIKKVQAERTSEAGSGTLCRLLDSLLRQLLREAYAQAASLLD